MVALLKSGLENRVVEPKLAIDNEILVVVPYCTLEESGYKAMAFRPEELALLEYTVHRIATNGAKPGDYFRSLDQLK
jgi:hypothetical protein